VRLSVKDRIAVYGRAGANALGLAGRRAYPPAIIWVLTQRCFYRCLHCDSWRDERPIDGEALVAIAERVAAVPTKLVALSGGEPLMVKRLPVVVARLKRARKVVSINTNGHLLADHAAWLVDVGVDHVQVSIDGHTAALHDGIRRCAGSFERILAGLEALRARRGRGGPRIAVCGVVMKENAAHVAAMVDRFASIADAVELQPLHDSPGLLATAGAAAFDAADRRLVERQVAIVMERHPAFANGFYRNLPRFLFEPESMRRFAVDHCLPMIFNTLTIREDGAYRICRYPLEANARDTTIRDVWNGPARWALYRSLARDGCAQPCWIRCHTHPSAVPGRLLRPLLA
jgi:MoaA/NifB/PqqE/SkfB family radical SAM enzyme